MKCEERICPFPDSNLGRNKQYPVIWFFPDGTKSQPAFHCQAKVIGKGARAINPADVVPEQNCLTQIANGFCPRNFRSSDLEMQLTLAKS